MTTSTTVHSNAFNFTSFIHSQVDPRTGQYTCALSLPELKANALNGPVVPLQLNFNPLNASDSGFGKGWNLQLSQYNPNNRILSLSTGETFKVNPGATGMEIPEKKIDSFHFSEVSVEGVLSYRVEHKSGLVEILQPGQGGIALPVTMLSPQGQQVTLKYTAFHTEPLLSTIVNGDGSILLSVQRSENLLTLTLHPGSRYEAKYSLQIIGGETRSLELPTEDKASWRFEYSQQSGLTCLKSVGTPTGGSETVSYSGTPHYLPGVDGRSIPRVESHLRDPGFQQPVVHTRYEYDGTGHNFLGYGSGITWGDDGLDNLYKVPGDYTYETTEKLMDAAGTRLIRSTRRQFNRFHLLTLEEVLNKSPDAQGADTLLVTETEYHITPGLPFNKQPRYCQLPKKVIQTWRNAAATAPNHIETVSTTYDDFGNLLTQVAANGVTETSEWYAAEGEAGCPQDPQGFVRNLKSKTVTPANSGLAGAPVLKTRYRYDTHPGLPGTSAWLAVAQESLHQVVDGQEHELQHTAFSYFDVPSDAFLHGRTKQQALTLNGQITRTDFSYDTTSYLYAEETVLNTVSTLTGFDDTRKTVTLQYSLLSGDPLLNRDDNDVEIAYEYDLLSRVTKETVAPGTEYEASRTYRYALANATGQQATQTAIDVKGVETVTYLDGHNRVIKETRRDADALGGNANAYRDTYRATYNEQEALVSETVLDWEGAKDVPLTSHFHYDSWGQQRSRVRPDGVEEHEATDPIARTTSQWVEGMGKTITHNNLFDKPDKVVRIDLAGRTLSEHDYRYDGLGRTAEETNAVGKTTRYEYDAYDRMTRTQLPDENWVVRAYAAHSSEDLPIRISVNDTLLGEQRFDGLDRMIESITGGRKSVYAFDPGQRQPKSVTRPSNVTTQYTYRPELGEDPEQRIAVESTALYAYDPQSARLNRTEERDAQGTLHQLSREYFSTGEVKSEARQSGDGEPYTMHYNYTRQSRLVSYTDVLGQQQTYHYDAYARLTSTALGSTHSTFSYDALGQLKNIETVDGSQRLNIALEYDDFGREVLRTFDLGQGIIQTLEQTYDAVDRMTQRTLRQGALLLRDEVYGYDARGRLESYECAGDQPPIDPYGKPVRGQIFGFDELDNIYFVETSFELRAQADLVQRLAELKAAPRRPAPHAGQRNTAYYNYDNQDPCQLSSVENDHKDYPQLLEFTYDADGNLLQDEAGRTLGYDSLGRLTHVSAANDRVNEQAAG